MYQIYKETLLDIILNIEGWIRKNDCAGYDPYDLKATPLALSVAGRSNNSYFFLLLRELLYEVFLVFPKFCRILFNVRKSVNPKAVALYSSGYLSLYKITGNDNYLNESRELLRWLIENKIEINGGFGWGYPFDWQSTAFIPANTPNGIVTTAVAETCWEHYRYTKDKIYLDYCISIARFLYSLPIDHVDHRGLCFSYTLLFINHVHNVNLFVAEFLYKIGRETGKDEYINQALDALNYTLSDQRADGSFDYNGPPEKPMNRIDHYHTGYVLRMLHSFWQMTGDESLFKQLKKGYDFYIDSFFENEKIPKFSPFKKYRIDIHSSAESILCITLLAPIFNKGGSICEKVIVWTINNLMNRRKTYFYHGIFKSKLLKFPFKSRIAYSRWGQAWMFKSLTTYYLKNYVEPS
jgi:hypothetical protein